MTTNAHTPYKATLRPVTPAVYPNGQSDTCWKSATIAAILAAVAAGESYGAMGSRLGFNGGWLHMVAHGKRPPTRRLARALGVAVERPDDRVQFSVWMTREERDALLRQIAARGMTRREWLQAAAETQPPAPVEHWEFSGWLIWRDGELVTP